MSDLDTLYREIESYLKKYAIDEEARYVIAPPHRQKIVGDEPPLPRSRV